MGARANLLEVGNGQPLDHRCGRGKNNAKSSSRVSAADQFVIAIVLNATGLVALEAVTLNDTP